MRPLGADHGVAGKPQQLRSQSPPPEPNRAVSQHPLDYDALQEQARERVREHNRQRRRRQREEEERRQQEEHERQEKAQAAIPAIEEHRREVARRAAENQRRDRLAKESALHELDDILTDRRERKQRYLTPDRIRELRRAEGRAPGDSPGADNGSAADFPEPARRGCTREPARRRRRSSPRLAARRNHHHMREGLGSRRGPRPRAIGEHQAQADIQPLGPVAEKAPSPAIAHELSSPSRRSTNDTAAIRDASLEDLVKSTAPPAALATDVDAAGGATPAAEALAEPMPSTGDGAGGVGDAPTAVEADPAAAQSAPPDMQEA